MTDKPQLDHDGDGKPGGAKPAPTFEWIVTRGEGLIRVTASEVGKRLQSGARRATGRDFQIAGIDPA